MNGSTSIPLSHATAGFPSRCPRCGTVGYGHDNYCACCGTTMSRLCRSCGNEIMQPLANYCSNCGIEFQQQDGQRSAGTSLEEGKLLRLL